MIKKIIVTGGHPSPAISFIQKVSEIHPEVKMVFVGKKFDTEKRKSLSFEYSEMQKYKITFVELNTGRITRIPSIKNLFGIVGFILGIIKALIILLSERPQAVMSFGGYIALPVSFAAFFLGIKVYTHEQTISPGVSNKLISLFAKKIFVSFKESIDFFPSDKVVYSGNLLRMEIFKTKTDSPFFMNFPSDKPCIYVTGGSLGAHSINVHIENILEDLLKVSCIIHQTGGVEEYKDYERLSTKKELLEDKLKNSYIIKKHILSEDIGSIYAKANLVISRSGANTIFELVALSKPSVLIPLPWSANGEQLKHAQKLADLGCAEIFMQEDNSEKLLEVVKKAITKLNYYEKNIQKISSEFKSEGAGIICREIFSKN